jgi:hypothetical protein
MDGMRARAAEKWNCPESAISVTNEGPNAFRASGCGKTALYQCSGDSPPSAGSPPQSDPRAADEHRYEGVGLACYEASR